MTPINSQKGIQMDISENWMLHKVYYMCKEILERLEKLENAKTEETETSRETDDHSNSWSQWWSVNWEQMQAVDLLGTLVWQEFFKKSWKSFWKPVIFEIKYCII